MFKQRKNSIYRKRQYLNSSVFSGGGQSLPAGTFHGGGQSLPVGTFHGGGQSLPAGTFHGGGQQMPIGTFHYAEKCVFNIGVVQFKEIISCIFPLYLRRPFIPPIY